MVKDIHNGGPFYLWQYLDDYNGKSKKSKFHREEVVLDQTFCAFWCEFLGFNDKIFKLFLEKETV